MQTKPSATACRAVSSLASVGLLLGAIQVSAAPTAVSEKEPNNSPSQATYVTSGTTEICGNMASSDLSNDYYAVDLAPKKTLTVTYSYWLEVQTSSSYDCGYKGTLKFQSGPTLSLSIKNGSDAALANSVTTSVKTTDDTGCEYESWTFTDYTVKVTYKNPGFTRVRLYPEAIGGANTGSVESTTYCMSLSVQ